MQVRRRWTLTGLGAVLWLMLAASAIIFARVQREYLEMLRDEMTWSCWRQWYASHPPDEVPPMRDYHGRTIPARCETP